MVADGVRFTSPQGAIAYTDSLDHFENALLRLMRMNREEFERWLALAEEEGGDDVLPSLGRALLRLRPLARSSGPSHVGEQGRGPRGEAGVLWHPALTDASDHGVARSLDRSLSWLVRRERVEYVREVEPPLYEEGYFEGDPAVSGGYGDYAEQRGWRLEKAARQVRELRAATRLQKGRVLDVGSGYGYFRKALDDAGYEHDGVEVSAFARRAAHDLFGFETGEGTLEDHEDEWVGRFDAVTLWDVIEHMADPVSFLTTISNCLSPGGFVAIKTPSIACAEAAYLGPHYHSLKREHLVLFSPSSLESTAADASLELVHVETPSHLLQGFCGRDALDEWEKNLQGADIVAFLSKRG